jgi:hypothetical protein
MEEAGEIGAGRHADAGEGLLDGACAADAGAALDDQNALAGAGEIGRAGEAVVARADDDGVPGLGGEVRMGMGRPISPAFAAGAWCSPILGGCHDLPAWSPYSQS